MRPRPSSHADVVARRLELLSAELAGDRSPALSPDLPTHLRPAAPAPAPSASAAAAAEPEPVAPIVTVATVPSPGRHAARRRSSPARWLPDGWLPESWAGQVSLGPGPVAVLAVLVALGLAGCCWWLLRSDAEPVPSASPVAGGLTTPVPVGASSAAPQSELVVDVAGKVRRPGIAVLEPGARVIDAIRAAGGARPGVDLSALNLARQLVDGEQVLVGVAPVPGVAASAASQPGAATGGSLVNINTASATQLEELPGVGPVTAASIIAFRDEHGAFRSVDELLDVSGIGEATLAELAPHVTL